MLKKSITKFLKLSESAKEKKNYMIAEMINFLEEKNKNFSSEEKEKINDYIFTNISSIIDYTKLVDDIPSSIDNKESLTIFKFLYENLYYTGNKFKSNNNFDKLIENALEKSFTAKNTNEIFLSQIIQIFWKYMIYNKSEEAESIFTKVSSKFIECLKGKQNLNLVKTVLKSLCSLLEDEIKLFPFKTLSYFTQIEIILKQTKIMDQEVLKEIYKRCIEIIFVTKFI